MYPTAMGCVWAFRGRRFEGIMCHYVFMCLAPSFLPSRGGAVTRIRESTHGRMTKLPARAPRSDGRAKCPPSDGPSPDMLRP